MLRIGRAREIEWSSENTLPVQFSPGLDFCTGEVRQLPVVKQHHPLFRKLSAFEHELGAQPEDLSVVKVAVEPFCDPRPREGQTGQGQDLRDVVGFVYRLGLFAPRASRRGR